MRRQKNLDKRRYFIAIFLIGIFIGFGIGYYNYSYKATDGLKTVIKYVYKPINTSFSSAKISLAAVDQNGNGVVTPLVVEARPGDGKILTNIERLLFWIDTQQSIQTAKYVAKNVTNIDTNKYDLVYTIKTNATLVGGPSAGASLTVATIAALENKTVKDDVMMTGTINSDGTVGEVGGVLEKAEAAKELGAKMFLVPKGQGQQTYLKPEEKCVKRGGFIFCETKYKQITVNIGEEIGITVIEVDKIEDALKYFIF